MPTRVKISLADQLMGMSDELLPGMEAELERVRPEMLEEMAGAVEARVQEDVFGARMSPYGDRWRPLAPLTRLSKVLGGGSAPGQGRSGKLRRSFLIGDPNNVFEVHDWGFVYGSKLRKGGASVAASFQETYSMPKTDDFFGGEGFMERKKRGKRSVMRFNIGKRAKIRQFMLATAGIPAPGPGRSLAHPGRRIMPEDPIPEDWLADLQNVGAHYIAEAFDKVRIRLETRNRNERAGAVAGGRQRR